MFFSVFFPFLSSLYLSFLSAWLVRFDSVSIRISMYHSQWMKSKRNKMFFAQKRKFVRCRSALFRLKSENEGRTLVKIWIAISDRYCLH
jgi:hypothetical protein